SRERRSSRHHHRHSRHRHSPENSYQSNLTSDDEFDHGYAQSSERRSRRGSRRREREDVDRLDYGRGEYSSNLSAGYGVSPGVSPRRSPVGERSCSGFTSQNPRAETFQHAIPN